MPLGSGTCGPLAGPPPGPLVLVLVVVLVVLLLCAKPAVVNGVLNCCPLESVPTAATKLPAIKDVSNSSATCGGRSVAGETGLILNTKTSKKLGGGAVGGNMVAELMELLPVRPPVAGATKS